MQNKGQQAKANGAVIVVSTGFDGRNVPVRVSSNDSARIKAFLASKGY